MLLLNKMENLKLEYVKIAIPKSRKNKDMCILLNTMDTTQSKKIITNMTQRFMNFRISFKDYFYPYKLNFKVFNKQVLETLDTTEIYKDIKKNTEIKRTYKTINAYANNNLLYDISIFNENYFNKKGRIKGERCINEYWDMIINIINSIPQSDKTMVIDIYQWGDNLKNNSTYNYINANTPLTFLLAYMGKNITKFKKINCKFLLLYGKYKIYIDPSQCVEKESIMQLKKVLRIMKPIKEQTEKEEEDNTKSEIKIKSSENINDTISKIVDITPRVVSKFNGDTSTSVTTSSNESFNIEELKKELADDIDENVEEVVDDSEDDNEEEIDKKVENKLNNDEEFLSKLDLVATDQYTNISAESNPRNRLLYKNQSKIQINKQGKTIDQILKDTESKKLIPKKIKSNSINTDFKEFKLSNFTKNYNDKLMEKDIISILNCFKDKRFPVYVLDIKKENTSTEFDKKDTYTVTMESSDRLRHTIKFDMPRFIDNSFLYLSGNKKNIVNQLFLKPVAKTAPDTVQLCSNYNKIFLRRRGNRVSPKLERFKKAVELNKGLTKRTPLYLSYGDSRLSNSKYITVMDYDDIATNILDLFINNGKYHFYFNQHSIRESINALGLQLEKDETLLPVCIKDRKEILYINTNTGLVKGTNKDFLTFLIDLINEYISTFKKDFSSVSVGKRYIYTTATLMKMQIPVILLCAYLEGLTTVLKKGKINHYFSDTRPNISQDDKGNKDYIEFKDGFLVYDRYPIRNSLLLDALSAIPTKDYNYSEFDNKELYVSLFDELYGNKKILNAFENFYDLFIDPITLEVLQDLKLPTGFVELVLYGNSLLEDNIYTKENNVSLYRLRNNEMVNAYLYKALADAYSLYRTSYGNKTPIKMSIPQDQVIKDIQTSQVLEDYSTLNPLLEAEKLRATSFKGPSGMNQQRAYTFEKRSYDKSMKGILALSTPASGSVGIVRQLPMDINLLSPRGYFKITENDDELNSANMYSPAELMVTGSAEHDDAPRVAMMYMQAKQVVPCNNYNEKLFTNGADDVLAQIISNEFAFKAKEDGQVVEINDKTGLMIIKYKSGKKDVVNLNLEIVKNSAGGSYLPNKLVTQLKVGNKFKQDDIIAYNDKFFNVDSNNNATSKIGTLAKIALVSGYFNYEDSVLITQKLASKMVTDVTKKRDITLGKNSNIDFIVNIGDHVEIGDVLLSFDESFEDESLNNLLANMNKDSMEALKNLSKHAIKSDYAGEVVDIKIYYNVDKSELSDSARNLINKINKKNKDIKTIIEKNIDSNDESDILLEPTGKVETKYNKIKGVDVGEGMLIEIYINHGVTMGVGDKLVFDTALKGVTCKVCDKGFESYSEFRPQEEISAFLNPASELARMTKSIEFNMLANKLCIELTRKVQEIYEE